MLVLYARARNFHSIHLHLRTLTPSLIELYLLGPTPYSSLQWELILSEEICYLQQIHLGYISFNKKVRTQIFVEFHKLAKTQLGTKLKVVRTYEGGEINYLSTYFNQFGVDHILTFHYTSDQNDIVERKHRHLVKMGLTLMLQAFLPLHYLSDTLFTIVFLINCLFFKVLSNISPNESIFHTTHEYKFLCVWFTILSSHSPL